MSYRISESCQIPDLSEILVNHFGFRTDGVFVEIGAFDGESFSNTSGLADAGWKGVYIEPVQEFAYLCSQRHSKNDVIVENCAAGSEDSATTIFVGESLSTTKLSHVEAYAEIEWSKDVHFDEKREVPQRTLNSLLTKHQIKRGFELLVVDVEGGEPEVFAGFDIAYWHPRMMIVELEDQHPDFVYRTEIANTHIRLRNEIRSFGYREIFQDHINTVFVLD